MTGPGAAPVGVVVPAHDAERFLAATLASLQAQEVRSWACVVVDDGSHDGTTAVAATIAAGDPRVRLLRQDQAGVGAARMTGLRALPDEIELVLFLDSDDLLLPDALGALRVALAGRPDAVGAYGLADYVDAAGDPLRPGEHSGIQQVRRVLRGWRLRDQEVGTDTDFDTLAAVNPIWPAAVALLRRAAVEGVGGFDPRFRVQEDWELYLRMSRRGPFVPVDAQVAWYRRHEGNLTNTHDDNSFQQELLRHEAWSFPGNTAHQRRVVARVWRFLLARQLIRLVDHLRFAAREGRPAVVLAALRGAVLMLLMAVLPGPPRPRRWLVSATRRPVGMLGVRAGRREDAWGRVRSGA